MNRARFFRSVQDAPWYRQFLAPALDGVGPLPAQATVLDLGMGPGKLLELGQAQTSLRWAGADSDPAMLAEARQRTSLNGIALHQIHPDQPLPFAAATFDAVTCCSVLFLLPEPAALLREITRILRPSGRLVVLTPSGAALPRSTVIGTIGWDLRNWTFWLWRHMTAERGRAWTRRGLLRDFAAQRRAVYKRNEVAPGGPTPPGASILRATAAGDKVALGEGMLLLEGVEARYAERLGHAAGGEELVNLASAPPGCQAVACRPHPRPPG